jgi:hypothetical protein
MKAILPILAILGLSGGIAALVWSGDDGNERSRSTAAKSSVSVGDRASGPMAGPADLEARVARLEREVRTLKARGSGPRMASAEAARIELDDPDATQSPVLRQAIADVVDEREATQRVERDERRREMFAQMRTERVQSLTEAASLDGDQREAVAALWETEGEQMMALFSKARSGEIPFSEVRQQIEALRQATDASASEVLDEEQMAAYEQERPRGPGGGGRRGGRGWGGPPAGPPAGG